MINNGGGALLSSPNTFTAEQTINHSPSLLTQDGGGRPLLLLEGSTGAGANGGVIDFFGANGGGPNGQCWSMGIDTSGAIPHRDFFVAKVFSDGTEGDSEGFYISYGGGLVTNPSSFGIGLAQPGDAAGSYRLKVYGSTNVNTQGGVQIIGTSPTAFPLAITDAGPTNRLWVDPNSGNSGTWTLKVAGDTGNAANAIQVVDVNTPTTVAFQVTTKGNVTMKNAGANVVTLAIQNSSQTNSFQTAATGEFQIGNSLGTVITVGNSGVSWAALGFFGGAGVVKQTAHATTSGFTAGSGTAMNSASTSTGGSGATAYTFGDVVLALKNYGLLVV